MYGRLYAASLFVTAMVVFDGEIQTIARFLAAAAGAVFAVVVPGVSDDDDEDDESDRADRANHANRTADERFR